MRNKILAIVSLLMINSVVFSQIGVFGGASMLKPFQYHKSYYGLTGGIEIPTSDESSFVGRVSYFFNNSETGLPVTLEAINSGTTPSITSVDSKQTFNYFVIQGGRRAYFLESYDYGFGLYAGSIFNFTLNKAQYKLGDYDENKYRPTSNGTEVATNLTKGTVLGIGIGLNGGLKYSLGIGTIFFDLDFVYNIFAYPNNEIANEVATTFYSPINFNFNIGFRKDLF